jgi:hypothetical protein
MLDEKLLGIYLNDHLAGSTVGVELVKRARKANEEGELGDALARLAEEIEEDRRALEAIMVALDVGRDHPKVIAGWVAEKLGRLKPNGQLTGYSPLSRLLELEALSLGIAGKRALWEALLEVAEQDARLDAEELGRLADRAEAQRVEVERHRQYAAREALAARAPAA